MKLSFLGGARTVTGSMHLIEVNEQRVLLDCGMFQGRRAESERRNLNLPFEAHRERAHAEGVSHAHIDHSGNIPTLVRGGFVGDTPSACVRLRRATWRRSCCVTARGFRRKMSST